MVSVLYMVYAVIQTTKSEQSGSSHRRLTCGQSNLNLFIDLTTVPFSIQHRFPLDVKLLPTVLFHLCIVKSRGPPWSAYPDPNYLRYKMEGTKPYNLHDVPTDNHVSINENLGLI